MKKAWKTVAGLLVGLSAIGAIVITENGDCVGYDMKIPVNHEFTWCLDKDEYAEAKKLLMENVIGAKGYDTELAKALVRTDDTFRKKIAKVLISQYEVNGYVDFDNFVLHNYVLELHFQELKERGGLPLWKTSKAELDNKGKLAKIHESLKSNLQ